MVNNEQNPVTVGDPEIKDLMPVPGDAFEFVAAQRGVTPIGTEQSELGAGDFLNLGRKFLELVFEPHGAAEDHRSLTMSSIESYCCDSIGSSLCSLESAKSLAVGLRPRTVAANSTGSNGTSAFVFFVLAFIPPKCSREAPRPQPEFLFCLFRVFRVFRG